MKDAYVALKKLVDFYVLGPSCNLVFVCHLLLAV